LHGKKRKQNSERSSRVKPSRPEKHPANEKKKEGFVAHAKGKMTMERSLRGKGKGKRKT